MPAFNEEWFLARMVPGCKKYMDKVVVVDDGSTDRTAIGARKEPQIHSPPAELSACCARWRAGNADEYRSIALTHRKGCEERKAEVEKSLRPLRSLRLIDLHGIPTAQGNKAIGVFQTGFTGSTGCVLSFDPVMWSRMEKPQINTDEHRYDYNNSINIFQPARTHQTHFPEVPT